MNTPHQTPPPPRYQVLPNWSQQLHLQLYAEGYFPMADHTGRIDWYAADPRATLPLTEDQGLHIPRTIKKILRQQRFTFKTDSAFEQVIRACAPSRTNDPDDIRWLTEPIIDACINLNSLGHAHSIEAWTHDPTTGETHLAGGVYGISLGSAFFAESMFHTRHTNKALDGTNASTAALITLANHLHSCNYTILDIQFPNPHTQRFGIINTPRDQFLKQLHKATNQSDRWKPYPAQETINP